MKKNNLLNILLLIIGVTYLSGCINNGKNTRVLPTLQKITMSTPEITPTFPSMTNTPIREIAHKTEEVVKLYYDFLNLSILPSDQYIIFYDWSEGCKIKAMSLQGKLYSLESCSIEMVQSNNSRIFYLPYGVVREDLIDEEADKQKEYIDNCRITSITNDGLLFSEVCEDKYVQINMLGEGKIHTILKLEEIISPTLSPLGKKLVYCDKTKVFNFSISNLDNNDLLETDVFCAYQVFWAPSGNKIGINLLNKIIIFDVFRNQVEEKILIKNEKEKIIDTFSWFPNERYITYAISYLTESQKKIREIHIYDLLTEKDSILYTSDSYIEIMGWLNIHTPFYEGGRYIVLPREEGLYLRETFGNEGKQIYLLKEGDRITILDKSKMVDDEQWWLVETSDHQGWILETMDYFQDDWQFGLGKPSFYIGSHLIVTVEGDNLNLRGESGLKGKIIRKLQPSVRLSIINGPVLVDGYTWWEVSLDESNINGWIAEEQSWFARIPEQ